MIKIATIVGARPQFIKAAAISRIANESYTTRLNEFIIHTGQHYDENMSQVFFEELGIPHPKYNLEISGGAHGAMTGRMLESIEQVLQKEKPDWVLIYGDTNSTLAGALAAVKMHIPVAHVEAGLRSFNMRMPEEVNRIVSDRISSLLFCPTQSAVANLAMDGITDGVHNVGDVMFDVALFYQNKARTNSTILKRLSLRPKQFALATCHRAENTDDPRRLESILDALRDLAKRVPVVLPLHPRTRKLAEEHQLSSYLAALIVVEPLSFLDMVALEQSASLILTDSGGVQKEAFFYQVPCITMRDETEWTETVESGWNCLVGADKQLIGEAIEKSFTNNSSRKIIAPYGDGRAANNILATLVDGTT